MADTAIWVATLGATGLSLNVAPFLITGETSAFMDGLSLLGQQLNPQSLVSNASMQLRALYFGNDLAVFVVLMWLAFGGWIVAGAVRHVNGLLRQRSIRIDVLFAVVLSPLALELMILAKHFWPHYLQLFIPYAAVSVAFMLACAVRLEPMRLSAGVTSLLLLGAFLVVVRVDVSRSALGAVRADAIAHQWEEERSAVSRFLRQRGGGEADFLHPSHMYLHWTMGVPRYGFPHAAHTLHISQDWWVGLRKPRSLELPVTRKEYCRHLERHGPRFVLDRPGYWVLACFTGNPASRYRRAALLEIRPGTQLAVFERAR